MEAKEWQGLTDEHWAWVEGLFPKYKRPFRKAKRKGGRPRASDRKAFEALLWSLRGGTLERLPPRFGSRRTACRRLVLWFDEGLLQRAWSLYIRRLDEDALRQWATALATLTRQIFWMQMLTVRFWLEHRRLLDPKDAAAFRPSEAERAVIQSRLARNV